MLLNVKCIFGFSLQLLSETFLILGRIRRDIVINVQYTGRHVKYQPLLSDLNKT